MMSMTTTYRIASARDIPAMSAIRLAVQENRLRDPKRITPQMYADYLESLGRGWVCERDGAIAGFAYADRAQGSIWALFIDPAHEGFGIGSQLLALAVEYLFALGHPVVKLSTDPGTRADRFYAMQGWTRGSEKDGGEVPYSFSRDSVEGVLHGA